MSDSHDYDGVQITPMTLWEAVSLRPGMWFGIYPRQEWPLVMLAWTAIDLLRLPREGSEPVRVVVRADATFEAVVGHASILCPARAATAADVVRARQWWLQLCLNPTVSVDRQGLVPDLPVVPADGHGQRLLTSVDITVAAEIDPSVVEAAPSSWWRDWLDRLPAVLSDLHPEQAGAIVVFDEASSQTRRCALGRAPGR